MSISPLTAIAALAGLLGLLLLWSSGRRLRRGRIIAAGRRGLGSLLLLALGALFAALSMNLYTYSRLSHEQPAAQLYFERLAPQHYRVHLEQPQGEGRELELNGDEWQIDARILKWKGAANLLGLDTQYRLERLAGRYQALERERNGPRSVHALSDNPGIDLWSLARRYQRWLPWADASYGSATYLPMADGASFEVTVGQSGLIARPRNEAAERAVETWN